MFVFVGIDFDPWAQKIADEGGIKNSLKFSNGVKLLADNDQKASKESDPHIWLDPEIVKNQSKNILEKLTQIDPKNQKKYQENYQIFTQKLDNLDNKYKSQLSKCNKDTVVVSHDAYAYLSNRYKFTTKPIQGLSTSDSPTIAEVAQIINLIKTEKIKYIMVEDVISNSTVDQIKTQTQVELLELSPLESVDEENIDQTYLDAMEKNLENLTLALDCSV